MLKTNDNICQANKAIEWKKLTEMWQRETKCETYTLLSIIWLHCSVYNTDLKIFSQAVHIFCPPPFEYFCVHTHRHAGLTWEVVQKAGLGSNDPLGSCLAEDSDGVFWPLTKWCQTTAQLGRRCEDLLIGEPAVLTQNHLQGERWVRERSRVSDEEKGKMKKGTADKRSEEG